MADVTERLRIIIDVDGVPRLSDGTALAGDQVERLGEHLSRTGRELQKTDDGAASAAQSVTALSQSVAQGDWRGAAQDMAEMANSTGGLRTGLLLLGAGFAAAAIAGGVYATAMYQAEQETVRQANALRLTGNYAGLVGGQLNAMARDVAGAVNGQVSSARATLEGLVSTGQFTTQSLGEVARATELVAQYSGQTMEAVRRDFAGMADGVAKWAADHNKAYNFLTLDQYKYIKSLEDAGNQQEAMRVTGQLLNQHLGNQAAQLGTLQGAWKSVQSWASAAWDAILNVGRPETATEQLARLQQQLDAFQSRNTGRLRQDQRDGLVATLQAQIATARESVRLERQAADMRSESAQREQAAIAAQVERDSKKPKAEKVDPEIEARRRLLADLRGFTADYDQEAQRLAELRKRGLIDEALYLDGLQKLEQRQPYSKERRAEVEEMRRRESAAAKLVTDARTKGAAESEKYFQALDRENAALQAGNLALQQQAEGIGLTSEQLLALRLRRLDDAIAIEQQTLARDSAVGADEREISLITRRIELLQRQRGLTEDLGKKEIADSKRKDQEAEAKRFSDNVRDQLTDGLMRGFEAGKEPAQNLADVVGNMFKTRIMRALAEAVANPVLKPLEEALQRIGTIGSATNAGGGSSGFFDGLIDGAVKLFTGTKHTGGIAGGDGGGTRWVSRVAFAGAPRMHGGGIAGDEVPTILQKKEGVFTEGQMRALAPVSAIQPVTVNVHPTAGQTASVTQRRDSGGLTIDVVMQAVKEALADDISAGAGPVSRSLENRFGMQPAMV